ncbi:hypothetical protein ScPMuIL_013025 [Solemya velum]
MAFHDIDGKCCYIKSKCLPSMKQGVYEQWVCMLQQDPSQSSRQTAPVQLGLVKDAPMLRPFCLHLMPVPLPMLKVMVIQHVHHGHVSGVNQENGNYLQNG